MIIGNNPVSSSPSADQTKQTEEQDPFFFMRKTDFLAALASGSSSSSSDSKEEKKEEAQADALLAVNNGAEITAAEYFAQAGGPEVADLLDAPLLLPSAENVQAISAHLSGRLQQLMQEYDIPEMPDEISFSSTDNSLQIPLDYEHGDKLRQALADHPEVEYEIQTLSALSSHYSGIAAGEPFRQEMAEAETGEVDAIIEKYSYLFGEDRHHARISMAFGDDGAVRMLADGNALFS